MRNREQLAALIQQGIGKNHVVTVEGVLRRLDEGTMQLFEVAKGIVITEIRVIRDTELRRLLVYLIAGHDLDEWKAEMTNRLKQYAAEQGCEMIEAFCRPGLSRMLRDIGWKQEQVVMRINP